MAALTVALILALYSGVAGEGGNVIVAGTCALLALAVAGWVAVTLVPTLAKRTPIQRSGVRLAKVGTNVTATHPATASASKAHVPATITLPPSPATPEYRARISATVSAAIERKNARTPGRSAFAQSCARVIGCATRVSYSGTRTDSTISRNAVSVVSDLRCSDAWRALATTRCAKTATASCLKS